MFFLFINLVFSAEFIEKFHAEIHINNDSTIRVIETIKVRAENRSIKRGIYRDFPTAYSAFWSANTVVPFEILNIKRDGRNEPYHVKMADNGKRIYIGSEHVILKPGLYEYVIEYVTARQIQYDNKPGIDRFYWNVTGQAWEFTIKKASAEILFENGIVPGAEFFGYTGKQGEEGKDYRITINNRNNIEINSTKEIHPGQGLSVVVDFPSGIVYRLSAKEELIYFFKDNLSVFIGIIGTIIIFIFYFVSWTKYGIDPPTGTIIPRFEPPSGIDPAGVSYILKMGYDNKMLTASIINMAVKGHIKINEENKKYSIEKLNDNYEVLNDVEKELSKILFGESEGLNQININLSKLDKGPKFLRDIVNSSINSIKNTDPNVVEVSQKNSTKFVKSSRKLMDILKNKYQKKYFHLNTQVNVIGVILSIVLYVTMAGFSGSMGHIALFLGLWLTFWNVAVFALISNVIEAYKRMVSTSGNEGKAEFVFSLLFSLPFIIGDIVVLGVFAFFVSIYLLPILIVLLFINLIFIYLMKAPTIEGRKLMDAIEGFKLYLSVAEKHWLNRMNPPEITPEIFEKFLPYAFALGVEQSWSEKFDSIMKMANSTDTNQNRYRPGWYSGASFMTAGGMSSFSSNLGSSFSSSISSASSPSSSGGSGGSGGGGGGGGGGGW